MLYYTDNIGLLGGGYKRQGDRHDMASLLEYDCLARLCDAAFSLEGPEMQLLRSWSALVGDARLRAEEWLGHSTDDLRRLWQSAGERGGGPQKKTSEGERVLFEVRPESEEYRHVLTIFGSTPKMPRAYQYNMANHGVSTVLRVDRVENGMQEEGTVAGYIRSLQRGLESQGLQFLPGLHTRWAFHGSSAVESIVTDPISGFQPLLCGSRANAVWGSGTYFARDARYVYDGGFAKTLPDGSKQILLCLLATGMPCLGDPQQRGLLPFRQGRHRYNSSVDSLSNPEIFITQSAGAAYPAYLITFGTQ
jgi:hypothetical protein